LNGGVETCVDLGDTEQLNLCQDRATGLQAVIAVDDTTLGPGLGGVRWGHYPDLAAAATEARRLARVMTLKNACADLPYGGAKSVMCAGPDGPPSPGGQRVAQLEAFGRFVGRLDGTYVPGVDMGTSVDDLAVIGCVAPDVSCHHQDPSPMTAAGVFAGIRAAVEVGGRSLADTRVLVQGAGHVGASLARHLRAAGCQILVADIDEVRAGVVAAQVGGAAVDPVAALDTECDVFAPCAAARVIDRTTIDRLQCRIVAGAANDVLAAPELADALARRGIVYVPDFVINAGGVIHIHALRAGWGDDKLEGSLLAIGDRVRRILTDAARTGQTPVAVAESMASDRLGRLIALPA
jgi:leucine dehydrogenase